MRSSSGRIATLAFAWLTIARTKLAQAQTSTDVPSFEGVKKSLGPAIDTMVWPFYLASSVWHFIIMNTSVAIILSAISAALFALLAIWRQSKIARLQETFKTVNRDNWDRDVIQARRVLRKIDNEIKDAPGRIVAYAASAGEQDQADEPSQVSNRNADASSHAASGDTNEDSFVFRKITLLTIMNDYESLALGVKHGILDEIFLFQWMRTTLVNDWKTLSPLVNEYRARSGGNNQLYIEFEGLSNAWGDSRSYRTGRRINKSKRRIRIR